MIDQNRAFLKWDLRLYFSTKLLIYIDKLTVLWHFYNANRIRYSQDFFNVLRIIIEKA